MSRRDDLSQEDRRIWSRVAGSVTPSKPKKAARVTPGAVEAAAAAPHSTGKTPGQTTGQTTGKALNKRPATAPTVVVSRTLAAPHRAAPEELEPRRQRRLSRERDPIEAKIDLHGYGRFQAQDALTAFLTVAQARGYRAVLVITGQGRRGGTGVIKSSVHDWLTSAPLRSVVSGFAPAARKHGGEGALYVTIRRTGG